MSEVTFINESNENVSIIEMVYDRLKNDESIINNAAQEAMKKLLSEGKLRSQL